MIVELDERDSLENAADWEGRVALVHAPKYEEPSSYVLRNVSIIERTLRFDSEMTFLVLDEGQRSGTDKKGAQDWQEIC
ncbi:hypothetical protein [Paenibacillus nasutitermitis]|uniref:Uncharacterized protein n=1 Tax=Paenibacillus nasutitermitis TaxID=1652958 RepID=A0A916ZAK1_9BACL|nr:hypothetical protein [Paenibacillus nasutitermitis]GGD83440.1 hypothetical protein GCM10010911_47000 [Paenibacillus nasutitermitis]